jgi:hypothetical protein
MTLCGLPVAIQMEWPFHAATAGSDFDVIHGRMTLAGSELHAELSVQITQVIKEALPSLAREHAEAAVINAVRKDLDRKQLELVKSGKRQPVPVSSRHYDFKHNKLMFSKASDDDIAGFVRRKVYWLSKLAGGEEIRIAEPLDVLYLNTTSEHMLDLAKQQLMDPGLITMGKGWAAPTDKLKQFGPQLEHEMQESLHAHQEKHRFEKEGATHF